MLYSVGMKSNLFDQSVIFLRTKDLDQTSIFYEEYLDLPLVRDQGTCRIYKSSPTGYIGFCTHLDAPHPDGIILTLVTDNVDDWYQKLSDKGVAITAPPVYNPRYQIHHFFFKDPNGYTLEIQRFDDPLE